MSDTQFDFAKFFEEHSPQSDFDPSQGDCLKAMFEVGFLAKAGKDTRFFATPDPADTDAVQAVKAQAAAYAESHGGKLNFANPAVGIQFTKFNGTQVNKEPSTWKNDISTSYTRTNDQVWDNEKQEMVWGSEPLKWNVFTAPLYGENDLLRSRYGKELWVHIVNQPDPTFDKDNDQTWNKYNSWETPDGKTVAQGIPVLQAAFNTKAELVQYMQENGITVHLNGSDAVSNWESELETVEAPLGWSYDPDDGLSWERVTRGNKSTWTHSESGWDSLPQSEWAGTRATIAKTLVDGNSAQFEMRVNKAIKDWEGSPITAEVVRAIADIVNGLPPF